MSFFSNFSSEHCPGPITGNALNGLCEKVCIQAEKIFDAGMIQTRLENYVIALDNLSIENPAYPLTFVSARSSSSKGAVSDVAVDRNIEGKCARVQATVTIPLEIAFTDADGVTGTATGEVVINEDVMMYVPPASVIPFAVTAVVSCIVPEGTYSGEGNSFTVSACVTCILKIAMQVELLVPSYGYCAIPPAQEFSREVCEGFFELPLYPKTGGGKR